MAFLEIDHGACNWRSSRGVSEETVLRVVLNQGIEIFRYVLSQQTITYEINYEIYLNRILCSQKSAWQRTLNFSLGLSALQDILLTWSLIVLKKAAAWAYPFLPINTDQRFICKGRSGLKKIGEVAHISSKSSSSFIAKTETLRNIQ